MRNDHRQMNPTLVPKLSLAPSIGVCVFIYENNIYIRRAR